MNIKVIPTDKRSIFRYWLEFLKPFHKLRSREMDALALILYYRNEISKQVHNENMIQTILFSTETRKKMRIDLDDMEQKVFNNLLTSLRKKNVLTLENRVNPKLIPTITEDGGIQLVFNFKIKNDTKQSE